MSMRRVLAEFQNHLDDFEAEVNELVADAEAIVAGYRNGSAGEEAVAEFIEHWEEVAVHSVIETRAAITYPNVWQAIVLLQQAVADKQSEVDVAQAGERVKATLWQGFGAVRLAASQVQADT